MNKPIHPVPTSDGGNATYDGDVHAWAIDQADRLRTGKLESIDWGNVAEEIEDVAKRERNAAESALRVLMLHILKWRIQPQLRCRSWSSSIATQRLAYEAVIKESPSLRSRADDLRAAAFKRSRIEAAGEMDMKVRDMPTEPPSWTAILDEAFEIDND